MGKRNEEFLQAIIDTAREPMLVLNDNFEVAKVNAAFSVLFACDQSAFLAVPLSVLEKIVGCKSEVFSFIPEFITKEQEILNHEIQDSFGKVGTKTLLVSGRKLTNPADNGAMILLSFDDVTVRRRTEKALRDSDEKQRLLLEGAKDFGIVMTDPAGKIIGWNPGAETIIGFKEDEVLGKHICLFFTPEDRANGVPEQEMRNALKDGRAVDERWHIKKGGKRFFASGMMRPLYSEENVLKGFGKILRDETERHQWEVKIAEVNERLKMAIMETHHRVKNTLNLVASLLLLQSKKSDSSTSLELNKLVAHIQGFASLHDILTIKSHEDETETVLPVKEILERLISILRLVTEDVSIEYDLDDVQLSVKRCSSLTVVVNELVTNSQKHGAKRISVGLEKQGDTVLLEIVDDGPGFPVDFDVSKSDRIGFGLIQKLCKYDLGGQLMITNLLGGGTKISVIISLDPLQVLSSAARG